jgi:hypothetical protein
MTRDHACQLYIDAVSSIDADWQMDGSSSVDKRTVLHDHLSLTNDAVLLPRIHSLLCSCFSGSFDHEKPSDGGSQNSWLFSIYDPAACAFAVTSDAAGRVIGFAAAALFSATRRMNVFNLVSTSHTFGARFVVIDTRFLVCFAVR